ncbi:uncharacterized protein LOC126894006 [Daktulosphaira vitifoliae]|uniref:uncharacterized protein LOC126894006 n=1 Tax=Daktulosphaira vitifoliae TaxID=58002 RepID=UPI0021AA2F7E|nr:uncharacterized protein LOC126894006 [Daktulosphaira vitifoliae]
MGKLISLIIFTVLIFCVKSQERPFYASGGSYPNVLPQYLQNTTDLDNRFGENATTINYDKQWIDWIHSLPPEKQPFSVINAAHLNSSRYPQNPQQLPSSQTSYPQSSFSQSFTPPQSQDLSQRFQSSQQQSVSQTRPQSSQSLSIEEQRRLLELVRQQENLIKQQSQLISNYQQMQQNIRNRNK